MLSVPSRRWEVHLAYAVHLDRNEAEKASHSRISAGLVNFGNNFSRVGECENQGGPMTSSATGDTVRPFTLGRGRHVPTFFHGSTDVRTNVPGGYFIKISGYLLF
jgi:hypothetical protein